ncbi:MAG: potassium channel family protein [Pseudomonadota bacterium]
MFPDGYHITGIATVITVVLCVIVHYEGLRILTDRLQVPRQHDRLRVVFLILCLLVLHIVGIWLFGVAYYIQLNFFEVGELTGIASPTLFDCVYYSAMSYTTIGFGDIVPIGAVRLMTGMEGLTGLVMITWSASYTFLVMLKTWNMHD